MNDIPSDLRATIGKTHTAESAITAWPADVLVASFDRDDPPLKAGDAIPSGWHILYFSEVVKLRDTGADGHAKSGDFMPALAGFPRRMWASTKTTYVRPLHVGERIKRVSRVADIAPKEGKSGRLVFATVRHEISGESGVATVEELTVVYRPPAEPTPAKPPGPSAAPSPASVPLRPAEAKWKRTIVPSPVLLFRFSALTMNSHRIHYDRTYTMETEGYPGLLVHGPLQAALLLDLFRREMPRAVMKESSVRAMAPVFDNANFTVEGAPGADGKTARLWSVGAGGAVSMTVDVAHG